MRLLDLDRTPEGLHDPVLVVALDGWTDAGQAGTGAAALLLEQWGGEVLGRFDNDLLYDFRDRRPLLSIDRGALGDPQWPTLEVVHLAPLGGPDVLLVTGAEPDFRWQQLCVDLGELAVQTGAQRYLGLGGVPGPVPHTRPTRLICTGSDDAELERYGRPHEQVIVPASCQVIVEAALRDAGLHTLGLWARVPHYVAGEYPDAVATLLDRLGQVAGVPVDTQHLADEIEELRQRLDQAAAASPEIEAHVRGLEEIYDTDLRDDFTTSELPTGDELAAELERFLRDQGPG